MPYTPLPQPQSRLPQYATNHTSPPPSQSGYPAAVISPPPLLSHPHLPAPCRQLHPPKLPLYRPAVLRSTERPLRAPPTPPASSATSVNEDYTGPGSGECKSGLGILINRGGYGGIDNDLIEEEETGRVTGPPDRGHWKPDSEAPVCDAPMCVRNFSLVTRRHHCRRCGNVFCAQHTPHLLPLNQNAKFHPQGLPSRACDSCWNDYRRMLAAKRTDSLSSSSSSSSTISNGNNVPSSPIMNMGSKGMNAGGRGPMADPGLGTKMGSYVGSVPRDWSWSTF